MIGVVGGHVDDRAPARLGPQNLPRGDGRLPGSQKVRREDRGKILPVIPHHFPDPREVPPAPALFTSRSTRPNRFLASASSARTLPGRATSRVNPQGAPAGAAHPRQDGVGRGEFSASAFRLPRDPASPSVDNGFR